MNLIGKWDESMVKGNIMTLLTSDPRHIGLPDSQEIPSEANFADLVRQGINGVNQDQIKSENIMVQMITDPGSVDIQDVTVAMAQANMSLQMTKSIIDGAVRAYTEIMNMR